MPFLEHKSLQLKELPKKMDEVARHANLTRLRVLQRLSSQLFLETDSAVLHARSC